MLICSAHGHRFCVILFNLFQFNRHSWSQQRFVLWLSWLHVCLITGEHGAHRTSPATAQRRQGVRMVKQAQPHTLRFARFRAATPTARSRKRAALGRRQV